MFASTLAQLATGDDRLWTAFAVLADVQLLKTRNGNPYAELTLTDDTRTVAAKIWSDAAEALKVAATLHRGAHVKILATAGLYRGALQLTVQKLRLAREEDEGYVPAKLGGGASALVADLLCSTLVFDIETAPAIDLRKAPSIIAQAVTKQADRNDSDEGKVMSLSPYFGRVISLAVGDGEQPLDAQRVTVFMVVPGEPPSDLPPWILPVSERVLLQAFWTLAGAAEVVVTYNGRGFDVPFVVARSLIQDVPVRTDLLGNRFALKPHLDLFTILGQGARGPASLDVVCWALGLESPKETMDGSMVAPAYARGEYESIARYNAGDVRATTAVYQRVRDKLLRFREGW